jgi:hypothetical protein
MHSGLQNWMLAFLLLLGAFLWQRTAFPLWMVDIFPQQLGAYFYKHGQAEWMYTPVHLNAEWVAHRAPVATQLGAEGDPNTFLYPPFVAAMLSPVCEAPATLWRNVLFGINVFLIFVIAYQILLLTTFQRNGRAYFWALALVLLCYPLARATKLGQIVPLLSALTWMGLLAMRRERVILAGVTLGFVSAVKIFPLALLLLPLFGKRYKLTGVWLGTVAAIYGTALVTMGLPVHLYWWEVMREFSGLVQPFFGNQAPLGWFVRLFYHRGWIEVVPFTTPLLDTLRLVSLGVFLGLTVIVLWTIRYRIFGREFALAAGLLLSGVHLALPVMWEHYWVFVLPTLGWAIHDAWQKRDSRFWNVWLAVAAFFFLMKLTHFYGDSTVGEILSGSQMWGMLLLWVWFLRRALLTATSVDIAGKVTARESIS